MGRRLEGGKRVGWDRDDLRRPGWRSEGIIRSADRWGENPTGWTRRPLYR
jgi:hypothetical protein